MSWLTTFKYQAGSNGFFDKMHYAICRIAFSWNANPHQIAVFNNLVQDVKDERLALHYTYNRLITEELENKRQAQENIIRKAQQATSESKMWSTPNEDKINAYKQEVIDEQLRWEQRGLTFDEINKRRICSKNEPSRGELLAEPVLHKQTLFYNEFTLLVHDKLNGRYTIELQGPFWAKWERPIFRWKHIGNFAYLQQDIYSKDLFDKLTKMHNRYIVEENQKAEVRRQQEEFCERMAPYIQQLNNYQLAKELFLVENDASDANNSEISKPNKKSKAKNVDHVRAAMGQNASINQELMDDVIF